MIIYSIDSIRWTIHINNEEFIWKRWHQDWISPFSLASCPWKLWCWWQKKNSQQINFPQTASHHHCHRHRHSNSNPNPKFRSCKNLHKDDKNIHETLRQGAKSLTCPTPLESLFRMYKYLLLEKPFDLPAGARWGFAQSDGLLRGLSDPSGYKHVDR